LVGEIVKLAKERTKREQKGKERVKKQNSWNNIKDHYFLLELFAGLSCYFNDYHSAECFCFITVR
jgi:hypothetical protein